MAEADKTKSGDPRSAREATREETGRRERVPMGVPRPKLSAVIRPGYKGRWVNDDGDRVQEAQRAGYEFAEDQSASGRDKKQSRRVGVRPDGKPLIAYLMEIRQEYYDEDEAARMAAVNGQEAADMSGTPHGVDERERSGFYNPSQHPIEMDTSN